jgi:hypothetical protein
VHRLELGSRSWSRVIVEVAGIDARQRRLEGAVVKKNGRARRQAREAVAHLRGVLEMSERRACSIVRKVIRYRSRRPPDTELRARLRELANQRREFRHVQSAVEGGRYFSAILAGSDQARGLYMGEGVIKKPRRRGLLIDARPSSCARSGPGRSA